MSDDTTTTTTTSVPPLVSPRDRFAPFIEEILELPAFFLAKPLEHIAVSDLCSVEGTVAGVTGGDPFVIPSGKFKRKTTMFTLQINTRTNRQFWIGDMPYIMYFAFESIEVHGTKTNERKFKSFNNVVHQDLNARYYRLTPLPSTAPDTVSFQQFRSLSHHIFRYSEGKQWALDYPLISRLYKSVVVPAIYASASSSILMQDKAKFELMCRSSFTTYGLALPAENMRDIPISKAAILAWAAGESTSIKDRLLRSYHLKMLFYTSEWNLVSRYYHHDVLGDALPLASFLELYQTLCEQPISMCFQQRIQIKYEVPTRIDDHDNEVVIHRRLPELSMQHFMDIHTQLALSSSSSSTDDKKKSATSVSLDDLVLLTLYQSLKNSRDTGKHAYVTRKDLRLDARALCLKNTSLPREVLAAMDRSEGDAWWTALLKRMADDKIIKYEPTSPLYPNNIYLYECWTWEEVIKNLVLHLAQQQKLFTANESCMHDAPPPDSVNSNITPVETLVSCINSEIDDAILTTLKSQRGHLLCSEQQAALRSFMKNPVTVINGPAGSGKTDFLQSMRSVLRPRITVWYETKGDKKIAHEYDASAECIVATSMQGNNASDLNKVFVGSGSSTTHRLILQHHLHCPNYGFEYIASLKNGTPIPSPLKGPSLETILASNKDDKKTTTTTTATTKVCIFKQIRVLVIEEGSLYNPELMCKLGGIIALCGQGLERLVVVGDHKQLASTSGGNFLKDMTNAFDTIGTGSVHFTHDHRTSKESALLKHNNTAILASSPEYVKFDGKIAVHIPIHPQGVWDMTLTENELREILLSTVRLYDLTLYNHHFLTRVNKNRNVIEDVLRRHFFGKHHPTEDYARHAYGYPSSFKIVFHQNDYAGAVVANRIYIITAIIDLDFVEPTTPTAANMKRYVHINGVSTPANCSLVRTVDEVTHTNNFQNYSRTKRYLVLYEVSAFAKPLKIDAGHTLGDAVQREFQRFITDLRYPTTRSAEKMVGGPDQRSPVIHDNQGIFTVVMWTPEVRLNSSSAFCTTINKFQGSQLPKIAGLLLSDSPYDTQEGIYTWYTRAQEQLISIHNDANFAAAVMRKEPLRNSTLANKILEHADELGSKEMRERDHALAKQKRRELKEKRREIRHAEKKAAKKQKQQQRVQKHKEDDDVFESLTYE